MLGIHLGTSVLLPGVCKGLNAAGRAQLCIKAVREGLWRWHMEKDALWPTRRERPVGR